MSNLNLKSNVPQTRIKSREIKKYPLPSNPMGFGLQRILHLAETVGYSRCARDSASLRRTRRKRRVLQRFRVSNIKDTPRGVFYIGGDGGIRTHGTRRYTAFRVRLVITTSIRLHLMNRVQSIVRQVCRGIADPFSVCDFYILT